MSTTALRLGGVSKRYFDGASRVHAVVDVSLVVPTSVFWALEGPSGSGKTTLLGLMGGLITPTKGEVELVGRSIAHMRDHHRTRWRRRHVGFVFQELALISKMTLLENVLLPLAPMGGAKTEDRAHCDALLERFGLAKKRDVRVEKLSGGERQRGALARALMSDASVLLLDEPTAHVDADNATTIIEHLADLRDEGRTIIVSTHDPRLSRHPAVDRVLRVEAGALASPEHSDSPIGDRASEEE